MKATAGTAERVPLPLASRKEVAEFLGVPLQTLAVWATKGKGPKYRRIGRAARYDWADVHAWVEQQAMGGAA